MILRIAIPLAFALYALFSAAGLLLNGHLAIEQHHTRLELIDQL